MPKKKKVFIVNKSYHDYSEAEKFGELVFMSEGSINRYSASKIFRIFEPFIKESKKTDYVLLTSMTIMCSIICGMFGAKHGRLNLLLHKPSRIVADPEEEKYSILEKETYLERVIVFERKEKNHEEEKSSGLNKGHPQR